MPPTPNPVAPGAGISNPQLAAMAQADGLQVGGLSGGPSGSVYVGRHKIDSPQGIHPVATYRTADELMRDFYGSWSHAKIGKLGQQLAGAGWINQTDASNVAAIGPAYEKLLELAARMSAAGRDITPEDLLRRWVGSGAGGASRPSSYSTTTKDVDLTNPKTARALMVQSLQQRLGRDPSAAEQQAFLGSLHAAERDDPTIRTAKYRLNPDTNSYEQVSSTTKGGVDPSAYLSDYGEKHNQKEYGAYQAAATYFPALMDAVRAAV